VEKGCRKNVIASLGATYKGLPRRGKEHPYLPADGQGDEPVWAESHGSQNQNGQYVAKVSVSL